MDLTPRTAPAVAVTARNLLGEGATWDDATGRLWWCDIEASRLHALVEASGQLLSWDLPARCGSFGLTTRPGLLLLALEHEISLFDTHTAVMRRLASLPAQQGLRSNDGRCDPHGFFVFGTKDDTGASRGCFWQYSARFGLRPIAGLPQVAIPNSIAFSPDGRQMYWCDSRQHAIHLSTYDPQACTATQHRRFAGVEDAEPDGACVDSEGFLWSAHWGGARVIRYTPAGAVDQVVPLPARQPTCVALGGRERRTLYVTSAACGQESDAAAGQVFSIAVDVPGRPEPRFQLEAL